MSKCTDFLNSVIFECDWKDVGLLGLCAGSLGALVGMVVPEKYKNAAAVASGSAVLLSAVALTVRGIAESCEEVEDWDDFEDWDDEEDEPGFVMRITAEE